MKKDNKEISTQVEAEKIDWSNTLTPTTEDNLKIEDINKRPPILMVDISKQLTQNEIDFIRACYASYTRDWRTQASYDDTTPPKQISEAVMSLKDKGILQ